MYVWSGYRNFNYICRNFLKPGKLDFKNMLDCISEDDWKNIIFSKEKMSEERIKHPLAFYFSIPPFASVFGSKRRSNSFSEKLVIFLAISLMDFFSR
jgi:hypothetical protein